MRKVLILTVVWSAFATGGLSVGLVKPAQAQATYGIAVDTANDSNPGVTASDFYTLLDNALTDDEGKPTFSSLITIFGSCYSAPFSKGMPNCAVGKSGAPVAVLAATDANNAKETCSGSQKGNLFLLGMS